MSEKTSDRLRHIARYDAPWDPRKACAEAADELDAKDAEIERLRKALNETAGSLYACAVVLSRLRYPSVAEAARERADRARAEAAHVPRK